MPFIPSEQLRKHKQLVKELEKDRSHWRLHWRELADNYLPQRYRWLLTEKEYRQRRARSKYIINSTGTNSARILGAGLMNGVTSPARPWFKLRVPGFELEDHHALAIWLDQVERAILRIMSESNFYNAMATLYLDLAVFGTGACLIYPDFQSVIRCYNPPLGEYVLGQSARMDVNMMGRNFLMKVHQVAERWPDRKYWSDHLKNAIEQGGSRLDEDIEIAHFIGPNAAGLVPNRFSYYELYWEARRTAPLEGGSNEAPVLEVRGFHEKPALFMRWELSGNEVYGVGPGSDALGDVIELQHIHKNKATALEKMHRPPLLADLALQNQPMALMPDGVTFVPNLNANSGAKPIFTVSPSFNEFNIDIRSVEGRIRQTFYNDLFASITQLETVRSAEEIVARKEERLVLLGSVLERIRVEGLDPAIDRIFAIAQRSGLIPPLPAQYEDIEMEIQYVSILATAQRAIATAPTERFLQLTGNLAPVVPGALDVPNFDTLLRNYARDIGVRPQDVNSPEVIEAIRSQREEQAASAAALEAGDTLSKSAKNLSDTNVGGGRNALERLIEG